MTLPGNSTFAFLGSEADWTRAEIQLDDVHGLWGGQMVTVSGLGRVSVKRVGPAFREGQWETSLTDAETRTLFHLFIAHDFATLTLPKHTPLPDEAHPQITLTNARGETHTVLKWARQNDSRFEAVYAALCPLAEGKIA